MVTESEILSNLNEQQRQAVEINTGSLLVFAGAGSGKTRVITSKIAYAVNVLKIPPYRILAVTFTNKACHEMQERVEQLTGSEVASRILIRTFHSFGVWLLRRYPQYAGLTSSFSIYDDRQSLSLLKQCFPNADAAQMSEESHNIAVMKEKGQKSSSDYYLAYQSKLREINTVDFGDLINLPVDILSANEDVRTEVQNRFSYILVDEYQDTNPAQLRLLKLLVGPQSFLCVVGDDDQSIYSFRNADVKTILGFGHDFEHTKQVVLSTNYRCNERILTAAKDVIEKNSTRARKGLVSNIPGGTKPQLHYFSESRDEAQFTAKEIKRICNGDYSSCAVLYRTNNQADSFEDVFLFNQVPYRIVGDISFYRREEIADAVAALKLLVNPADSVSFERLVGKLVQGAGKVTIRKIMDAGDMLCSDLMEISADMVKNDLIKGKAAEGLEKFSSVYVNLRSQMGTIPNYELAVKLVAETGLGEIYKADEERIENLDRFVNKFKSDFYTDGADGLFAFLETVSLEPDSDDNSQAENKVTLMTMHKTKGLEFDHVFVTGLEEELFFGTKTHETEEVREEERRLLYVAMTRARKNLYLSACDSRYMYSHINWEHPLRFLKDIKENHVDVTDSRQFVKKGFIGYGGASDSFSRCSRYGHPEYGTSGHHTQDADAGSHYINTHKRNDFDDDWKPSKPKVTLVKKPVETVHEVVDWKTGDRVNSPILGPGTITGTKMFGAREVLVVNFDNGKMGTFVKESANFTRLK